MIAQPANGRWVIWLTLLGAVVLHLVPLSENLRWWRPDFPLLVLFYWVLALPYRIGVFSAALVGAVVGLLEGGPPSAVALGAVAATVIILITYQRLRLFTPLQQSIMMALLLAFAYVLERWLEGFVGVAQSDIRFLFPAVTSAFCWPLVRGLLRGLRRYYEVT